MQTRFSQCFDRNPAIVTDAEWTKDLIPVEAPVDCRLLNSRGAGDEIEWLVQVHWSDRPGAVAFQWLRPKHI